MPSGKDQMLDYLKRHLGRWVHNQDLREATGLNDAPRTVRQLKQEGWRIDVRGDGYLMLTSCEKGKQRGERRPVSEKERYEVFARDGFRCRACGRGASNGVKLTVDHVVPVDWGGKSEISNYASLCAECNRGKKAWTDGMPGQVMKDILAKPTVESRIEALFDSFPNQDVPSTLIQVVSKGSLDWQRALRRIRQRTGKAIKPTQKRTAYRYERD